MPTPGAVSIQWSATTAWPSRPPRTLSPPGCLEGQEGATPNPRVAVRATELAEWLKDVKTHMQTWRRTCRHRPTTCQWIFRLVDKRDRFTQEYIYRVKSCMQTLNHTSTFVFRLTCLLFYVLILIEGHPISYSVEVIIICWHTPTSTCSLLSCYLVYSLPQNDYSLTIMIIYFLL